MFNCPKDSSPQRIIIKAAQIHPKLGLQDTLDLGVSS
jgi:hypothetical protein